MASELESWPRGAVYPLQPVYDPCSPLPKRAWARLRMSVRQAREWYVDRPFWWIRLGAWIVVSAPLVVIRPWAPAFGPILFESGFFLFQIYRRRRALADPRRGPLGEWPEEPPDGDGVREPRRPTPLAGAGAVALPEPASHTDTHLS